MTKKRVFGYLSNGEIEIASYTEDQYENFKELLYNSFFANECTCNILGINKPENELSRIELTKLCVKIIEDGLTLVARDIKTNKLVGFAINKIQTLPNPGEKQLMEIFYDEECKSESTKALMEAMFYSDGLVDVYEIYKTKCTFEIMFMGTDPAYTKRSIARVLCEYSIQLAKEIKNNESTLNKPTVVRAFFTSAIAQHIGKKLGFKTHVKSSYDEYTFRNKTFTELVDDPNNTSVDLAVLVI